MKTIMNIKLCNKPPYQTKVCTLDAFCCCCFGHELLFENYLLMSLKLIFHWCGNQIWKFHLLISIYAIFSFSECTAAFLCSLYCSVHQTIHYMVSAHCFSSFGFGFVFVFVGCSSEKERERERGKSNKWLKFEYGK